MSKKEISQLKNKYLTLTKENLMQVIGVTNDEAQNIFEVFMESIDFDSPDGYCIKDNTLYILEHFQVDSSKNTSKGSKLKGQESIRDKNIEKKLDKTQERNIVYRTHIELDQSILNYLNTIDKVTEKHYNKIKKYIKKLNEIGVLTSSIQQVRIIFIIENSQEFGPMYIDEVNTKTGVFYPLYYKEYIESLKKYKDLDYIIFFNTDGCKEKGLFLLGLNMTDEILKKGSFDSIDGKYLMDGYYEATLNTVINISDIK